MWVEVCSWKMQVEMSIGKLQGVAWAITQRSTAPCFSLAAGKHFICRTEVPYAWW